MSSRLAPSAAVLTLGALATALAAPSDSAPAATNAAWTGQPTPVSTSSAPALGAATGEVAGSTRTFWYNPILSAPQRYLGLPDFSTPQDLVRDGTLSFYLDNDMFAGTDENYTNGARLSWVSADLDQNRSPNLQRFLSDLSAPLRWHHDEEMFYSAGVSLTQVMFTPSDKESYDPPPGQRPYAGWTGLGFSTHAKSESALDSFELSLGVTGQWSFAENTQDFIHSVKGAPKANGWDEQIPTEVTVNLHYTHRELLFNLGSYTDPWRFEAIGNYGADLGNYLTQGRVGGDLRLGYHLPPQYISTAVDVNGYTHQLFGSSRQQQGNWSFFVGCGAEGRLVGYNVTLDGTMFSDSPSVDKRPLVGEVYGSLGMRWKNWTLSYRQSQRTEEFEGQGDPQSFGSIAVSVSF